MEKITTIGIDLAKNVFQAHCVNDHGRTVLPKSLQQNQVTSFFPNLLSCLVGMGAHAGSHRCARTLEAFSHTVKLMAPQFVKPYVKSNKNGVADAEVICEAVGRSSMRYVPVKNIGQQAVLAPHHQLKNIIML